jgi:EAL domain-containing protein (putative c-di-GMP-specific phosphodiesterase class I)/GGDEF domain-containing protein
MDRFIIENEEARQNALRNLGLLDTPPSESFDRITRLAARLLGAPVSTISLTDHDRQWFKSRFGVELAEIPRAEAPCNYAIHDDKVFIVPDLLKDDRFKTSVLANAGIRFYAGAPLITRTGYALGTLCVIDDRPRVMSDDEARLLVDLAAMVMTQIEVQNTIGRIHPASGLPNEYQFFEDLEDLIARHPDERRAGLLIELASQRQITHGLRVVGAAYAEELMRNATATLRRSLGDVLRIYHVGPTRCAILLDESAIADIDGLVDAIDAALRGMISYSEVPISPDPIMGAYVFALRDVENSRDVLRRLFSAADDARKSGVRTAFYNEIVDRAHARSFALIGDMRAALADTRQFSLVYQPVVDFASGKCVGAEALLRWRHKTLGDVGPAEFIPLAEETALIGPLTAWVIDTALGQSAQWARTGQHPKISINISVRNLDESDFAEDLAGLLTKHGVDSRAVQIEFTESVLVGYSARALEQVHALKEMGISIAIDDFGTGYSGLSYLQQLPATTLKIDQSFIKSLATSEHDQKLVRAIIYMAHDLGYRVVAEGVENPEAYDMLASWHCDEAQGYLIAHPLAPAAMEAWFEASTKGEPLTA